MRASARIAIAVLGLCVALPPLALAQDRATATGLSTLAGVIRDSTGAPLTDAEIILRDVGRGGRTDAQGRFTLTDSAPATYQVWFRHLGYATAQFEWTAQVGRRLEVAVTLHALPRRLDPVVVRADEERSLRGRSAITGAVIDGDGAPVANAEVQLVGSGRQTVARNDGTFDFRGLAPGTYVVRVRKLGYTPNMLTLQLQENDSRELAIRARRLPAELDAVVVNERSGYGRSQSVFDELDQRRRWHENGSILLGPEDLKRYYSMPLDAAVKFMGRDAAEIAAAMRADRVVDNAVHPTYRNQVTLKDDDLANDACILLNGSQPRNEPLRTYLASEIELIEIYPPGTDLTGSVGMRMPGKCAPSSPIDHPTYYVLWLKAR